MKDHDDLVGRPFLSLFQFVTSEPTGGGSYDLIARAFPLLLRAQTAHSMTIEQAAHSQRLVARWDVLLFQRHEQGFRTSLLPFSSRQVVRPLDQSPNRHNILPNLAASATLDNKRRNNDKR